MTLEVVLAQLTADGCNKENNFSLPSGNNEHQELRRHVWPVSKLHSGPGISFYHDDISDPTQEVMYRNQLGFSETHSIFTSGDLQIHSQMSTVSDELCATAGNSTKLQEKDIKEFVKVDNAASNHSNDSQSTASSSKAYK